MCSSILSPLKAQLCKGKQWRWRAEYVAAFRELKWGQECCPGYSQDILVLVNEGCHSQLHVVARNHRSKQVSKTWQSSQLTLKASGPSLLHPWPAFHNQGDTIHAPHASQVAFSTLPAEAKHHATSEAEKAQRHSVLVDRFMPGFWAIQGRWQSDSSGLCQYRIIVKLEMPRWPDVSKTCGAGFFNQRRNYIFSGSSKAPKPATHLPGTVFSEETNTQPEETGKRYLSRVVKPPVRHSP